MFKNKKEFRFFSVTLNVQEFYPLYLLFLLDVFPVNYKCHIHPCVSQVCFYFILSFNSLYLLLHNLFNSCFKFVTFQQMHLISYLIFLLEYPLLYLVSANLYLIKFFAILIFQDIGFFWISNVIFDFKIYLCNFIL